MTEEFDWPGHEPMMGEQFICPGCGNTEVGGCYFISRASPLPNDPDPYAGVLYEESCAACGVRIPGHLAERWNGLTVEQARQEWREKFAESPYLRYAGEDEEEEEEDAEDDDES